MQGFSSVYNELNQLFGLPNMSMSVVEKQINIDTQNEYFEYAQNFQKSHDEIDILICKEKIFDKNISKEEKKVILVQLAALNNIEAFRIIEQYIKKPNIQLYEWAYLALQESKLLIESTLLEEFKVLITTGLGGKGLKLRYFIVFVSKNGSTFTKKQCKLLKDESIYQFKKVSAEIEEHKFHDYIASFLGIIPISVDLDKLFHSIINECNSYGSYLETEYFITNVRIPSYEEIDELLAINNLI